MKTHNPCAEDGTGFVHVSGPASEVLKEIRRRYELRLQLEAERGWPVSDREFLEIVARTGGPKQA